MAAGHTACLCVCADEQRVVQAGCVVGGGMSVYVCVTRPYYVYLYVHAGTGCGVYAVCECLCV